jgi:hypothetical protein
MPKKLSKIIFHPILFAIYPILFLYSVNQNELQLDVIWAPIFISIIFSILIWVLCSLIFRSIQKGALFTSAAIVAFSSYGHVISFISRFEPCVSQAAYLRNDKTLFSLLIVSAVLLSLFLFRTKRKMPSLHLYLNVFTIVFILIQLVSIVRTENKIRKSFQALGVEQNANKKESANTPDIYYIVLDMYAGKEILQEIYGYDNSKFEEDLSSLEFEVLENAKSNYAHTYLSLTSSLNMEHVNTLEETLGKSNWSNGVIYEWMHNAKAMAFARDHGYKLINFQSGFGPTDDLKIADVNYRINTPFPLLKLFNKEIALTAFDHQYLKLTILSPFLEKDLERTIRGQFLHTFKTLADELPYEREKTFALAHIVLPHPPYLFDEFGNEIPEEELKKGWERFIDKENYIKQLKFTSDKTLETVKNIIERSETPPIVIIQADHGTTNILGDPHGWPRPAPIEGIKERMSILHAVYLPGSPDILYEDITPVNTFRFIYNYYFDANFELLPDTIYYTDFVNMLEFFDVTEELK